MFNQVLINDIYDGRNSLCDENLQYIFAFPNININCASIDNTPPDSPHRKIESLSFCHLARLH